MTHKRYLESYAWFRTRLAKLLKHGKIADGTGEAMLAMMYLRGMAKFTADAEQAFNNWCRNGRRATAQCEECGLRDDWRAVNIHHLTYARLGREDLADLAILCAGCHQETHGHQRSLLFQAIKDGTVTSEELLRYRYREVASLPVLALVHLDLCRGIRHGQYQAE